MVPEEHFKGLMKLCSDDDKKAFCLACEQEYVARHDVLAKHGRPPSHTEMMEQLLNKGTKKLTTKQKSIRAEIKLTSLCVDSQMPLIFLDHLMPLLHQLFDDESETIKLMGLNRDKALNTIVHILKPAHDIEMAKIMNNCPFSCTADQSTDISEVSLLGIKVRHEHPETGEIKDSLFALEPFYENEKSLATAEQLYGKFKKPFETSNIPFLNFIGPKADTCNVMFGKHNSLTSRLNEE